MTAAGLRVWLLTLRFLQAWGAFLLRWPLVSHAFHYLTGLQLAQLRIFPHPAPSMGIGNTPLTL